MVTSSKLIENTALSSSSKGIQNHCSNLYGFKSVKFRATSNFSGFKVENFIGKLTSATIKNNNVVAAASFYSEAQQPTSRTRLLDLIHSLEAVMIKTLKLLIPAAVMGSALSLALMMNMINDCKPALDFPDKHSLSSSSSFSFAESETQPEPVKLDLVPVYIVLCGVVASVVFSVKFNDAYSVSIYKIQVGLLFDQTLQSDLYQITKASSNGWGNVLEDTIESLDWHRSNWVSGNSSVNVVCRCDGNKYLEKISYEEQRRFDKERPCNLRKMERESSTSYRLQVDEFKDKYMALTIIVALDGKHKLPTICKRGDLDQALEKLKLYNSKNLLRTINVYQAPGKDSVIMSCEEIQECYPVLRHFNT
ncbi:hypothetical protein Q3G72_015066 [Acer saccharum]|nr:hypothetical protein Q3G72_015066 [Acer saccharum]